MKVYETREAAYRQALDIKSQYPGAEINEGRISLCGMRDGKHIEMELKTFEVCFERYDKNEGWMDCSAILAYKS